MKTTVSARALPILTVGALCTTGLISTSLGEDIRSESLGPSQKGPITEAAPNGGVAGGGCQYSYDEGTLTNAFGQANTGGPTAIVGMSNAYTAAPDCPSISSIEVAWGPFTTPQPCTVAIYADPNNDGDPSDVTAADLLASTEGMATVPGADVLPAPAVFEQYALSEAIDLEPGQVYHVIAMTNDIGGGEFPLGIDETTDAGQSWILLGLTDTTSPFEEAAAAGNLGLQVGNHTIRVSGEGLPDLCPSDIDGNGATDVDDLVAVILQWGCEGSDCAADINNDQVVNVDDLVGVILAWGPCPIGNDSCDTAQFSFAGDGTFFLGEVSCDPVVVGFNNTGATTGDAFSCADATADVWFYAPFNCTGKAIINTDGSEFDTVLEVYAVTPAAGDDCSTLELVGCDNDSGGDGTDSAVEVDVEAGTTLYIRVGGGDLGAEGAGTLNIYCAEFLPDPPPNDDCADAITLAPGESDSQQTITAADDPEAFNCGDIVEAPGAWYSVTGTGNTMTASLCTDTDFDTKIFVYCAGEGGDPCLDLGCIGGDDDGCGAPGDGVPSEISWCSETSRAYLVFVSGWNGATGNFTLSLSDDTVSCGTPDECGSSAVANDDCIDAETITNGMTAGTNFTATTSDAPANPDCASGGDGGVTANDVWYRYVVECDKGVETAILNITVCEDVGGAATFDTDMVVYRQSGSLGETCVNLTENFLDCGDDNCPPGAGAAPWHSHVDLLVGEEVMPGDELLIQLGGWSTDLDRGDYELLIECIPADDDLCEFATVVDLSGGSADVQIDNCDASIDDLAPICGASAADAPGRWLTFEGTGTTVDVVLCNLENPGVDEGEFIDTRILAYCGALEGPGCSDLECATDEDPDNSDCPFTESISFCTEPGRPYYLLILGTLDGAGGCEGKIDVAITTGSACEDPPCQQFAAPDSIADAVDVSEFINGDPIIASTQNATPPRHDGDAAGRDPEIPAGSPTCQWNGTPDDVHNTLWYTIVAPANGNLTIQTCMGFGDINDTIVSLYSGAPGSLVEVGCDEDGCNNAPPYYSIMTVTGLNSGETYYLSVANTGSWDGSVPGEFQINISSP